MPQPRRTQISFEAPFFITVAVVSFGALFCVAMMIIRVKTMFIAELG